MTTPVESECEKLLGGTDQLVVDSTHRSAVEQVLDELGIQTKLVDDAPAFDLALLTLWHKPDDAHSEPELVAELDPVLNEVRARLAGRCGGWVPLIGKNRPMTSQFGAYPQTKSHTLWDPIPAGKPDDWLAEPKGAGVRVGLLDTAIYKHDDLPDTAIRTLGFDKAEAPADAYFELGHGLFMAGLILKQAPAATVVARAALNDRGKASAWCVVKQLEEFYDDPPQDRVHVLVMACGTRTNDGRPPLIVERAVERLQRHMVIVAAAGNHGAVDGMSRDVQITRNSPTWPAALPGVIAAGLPTPFSDVGEDAERKKDYSPALPWVTCTINPGADGEFVSSYFTETRTTVELLSGNAFAGRASGFASWRGTSCAAAQLGGLIAAKMAEAGLGAREAFNALSLGDEAVAKPYKWTYPRQVTVQSRPATVEPNV
ncbi:S8/S53 family peptidase [Lentzea sp. NPDC006480]|uniref:S8/S53 family peptidase n=1 Tax=Lentzea sp. NPDC006480 TaxID=3157176 RepID=UPI0033AC9EB9